MATNWSEIKPEKKDSKGKIYYRSKANMVFMDENENTTLDTKIQEIRRDIDKVSDKTDSVTTMVTGSTFNSAGVNMRPDVNETWYRLGHIDGVAGMYGEFIVTHNWSRTAPIFCKFIVGGYNSNEGYNIKQIFITYPNPTSSTRNSATITKARVIYIPAGTVASVYVDICIEGGSYANINTWSYKINNFDFSMNKWVDDKFLKGATIPTNSYKAKECTFDYLPNNKTYFTVNGGAISNIDTVNNNFGTGYVNKSSSSGTFPNSTEKYEGGSILTLPMTSYNMVGMEHEKNNLQILFTGRMNIYFRKNVLTSPFDTSPSIGTWKKILTEDDLQNDILTKSNFTEWFRDDLFNYGQAAAFWVDDNMPITYMNFMVGNDWYSKPELFLYRSNASLKNTGNQEYVHGIGIDCPDSSNNNHDAYCDYYYDSSRETYVYGTHPIRKPTGIYNKYNGTHSIYNSKTSERENIIDYTSYIILSCGVSEAYRSTPNNGWNQIRLAPSCIANNGLPIGYGNNTWDIYLPIGSIGTLQVNSSDKRLKDDIKDTKVKALPLVNSIKFREFNWNNKPINNHQDIGMIADELEELDPHLVLENTGGETTEGKINPKCVDTFYLMGYYGKAIQELSQTVESQKKEIEELKDMVKDLLAKHTQ